MAAEPKAAETESVRPNTVGSNTVGPSAAWSGLLDRFEEEIRRVNRGETADAAEWTAPEGFPPLPAELAGRARSILERQRSTAERAADARRELGRELAAVRAIPTQAEAPLPRYLDHLA